MASILNGFVSNAVLYSLGQGHGHAFEEVPVTFAEGITIGSLLKVTDGVYSWAAQADAANVVGVLADGRVEASDGLSIDGTTPSGTYDLVVAVRAAGLGRAYLKFSDGALNTAGETALKALGFKIVDQY